MAVLSSWCRLWMAAAGWLICHAGPTCESGRVVSNDDDGDRKDGPTTEQVRVGGGGQ